MKTDRKLTITNIGRGSPNLNSVAPAGTPQAKERKRQIKTYLKELTKAEKNIPVK